MRQDHARTPDKRHPALGHNGQGGGAQRPCGTAGRGQQRRDARRRGDGRSGRRRDGRHGMLRRQGKIHGLDTYRRAGRQCRHTLVQHTREICRGAESELRPCTGRRCSERQHNIPARLAHHKEHPEQEPRYHNRSAHERDRRARTARDTRLGLRAEALVGRDTDGRLVVDARH